MYNSGYWLMVTHPTTNPPISGTLPQRKANPSIKKTVVALWFSTLAATVARQSHSQNGSLSAVCVHDRSIAAMLELLWLIRKPSPIIFIVNN